MDQIRQRILILALTAAALAAPVVRAQKFYPDDPLMREPKPLSVPKVNPRDINDYFDFFQNTFAEPGRDERKRGTPSPSEAVNTLGEVPDNSWFTNRIGSRPMTLEELVRGPGVSHAPATDKPWTVLSAKTEGITPGLVIRDSAGRRYFLKFDPESNPEMASAADVVGAKFFYDIGYYVPENYIVNFNRERLTVNEKSTIKDAQGKKRPMTDRDVDDVLARVPRNNNGAYRGMASLAVDGEPIGPHRYYGTRKDDPNDIVDHEKRRDQRGLYIFFAWLNHTDAKSINSLDTVVEQNGLRYVRHWLIDFGDIMGSDSDEPKEPWRGNVYAIDGKAAAAQFLSLGLYAPAWMRIRYKHIPEIGHFEYKVFDPERWYSNYPNPAFDLRTPGDTYWAAKKVMAFSDEAIRAIVQTGQYSDQNAADWATRCLIERRNKIGRAFLNAVLSLDNFEVKNGRLNFDDLAVKYGFHAPRQYSVQWSEFDNQSNKKAPIAGGTTMDAPRSPAAFLAADIQAGDLRQSVTVYLRGDRIVGIDRTW